MYSKKDFFNRIIRQVEFGIYYFLDDYLEKHPDADVAGLRCVHIIFSFHFELLLKALYVKTKILNKNVDINKELQSLGHNLEKIGRILGKNELLKVGIKDIYKKNNFYIIETENRNIKVEDFINIRYDFISGTMRNTTREEYSTIKEDLSEIKEIVEKLKKDLN